MKNIILILLFLSNVNAYSETYYCTQTAKVFVEPDNNVKKYEIFDEIYKLKIDEVEKKVIFATLDQLNAFKNSLLFEFDISSEDYSSNEIIARNREKTLLSDTKLNFYPDISSESKLVQTITNEIYTFVEYFKCIKENKY